MINQITIDNPVQPNLFAYGDALFTTATTAIDFVTDDLEQLAVELISNNEVRVKSGVFCIGGHYGYVPSGTFETCYISPGNMGFKRKDLIVARYTRVGNLDYIGIQHYTGVPTKGVPVVPSLTVSDLSTGGKIREIALHVVELNDMDIVNVESVFPVRTKKEDINALIKTSYYTSGQGIQAVDVAKLEICDIVTATLGRTSTLSYIAPTDGVWAGAVSQFILRLEPGYTASNIVVIPSVLSGEVIKMGIKNVSVADSDGIKKIFVDVIFYAFAKITTAVPAYFTVLFRYTKVKL